MVGTVSDIVTRPDRAIIDVNIRSVIITGTDWALLGMATIDNYTRWTVELALLGQLYAGSKVRWTR